LIRKRKDILEIFDLAEEIKVSKTGLKKIIGSRLLVY
jgi:DNA-directed RNA polymerase subunit beta